MRGRRLRLLAAGLAALCVAAAWLAWRVADRPPVDPARRARDAYDRGDWTAAEALAVEALRRSPDDPGLSRLLARALARRGRHAEAVARFAAVGGAGLDAEDLVLLGTALEASGRPILATAVVEAATRLDPSSRAARVALASLNDRAADALDGPRQLDQLTAVPDGRALAELAVGLAALSGEGEAGRLDPYLDRLALLDRATMAAIDRPDAARKRLARLLMEEGRAPEARDRLARLDEPDDPEARWLLARIALLDGDIERADDEHGRAARGFRPAAIDPEPCRYVGAAACAGCHRSIHRAQQSSHHARTIAGGQSLSGAILPRGVLADPVAEGVSHAFRREGDGVRVEARVGPDVVRGIVEYVLGSGHHGTTMLARDEEGTVRSLRMSYYAGGDHWDLTSGFPPNPPDPRQYLGEPLDPLAFRDCLHCHTTRFRFPEGHRGAEAADRGIGCERCHGPGEAHLRAVELGFPEPAIARPKSATPQGRARLCAGCHAADGKIPPSDPRFIRFQSTTLPFSRCAIESGGRLDCVACHDPHRDASTDAAHYERRCLACHAVGSGPPSPTDDRLRLEPVAATACPVSPAADCLRCHMPKVADVLPFTTFTDHHIRVHRGGGLDGGPGRRPGPLPDAERPGDGGTESCPAVPE